MRIGARGVNRAVDHVAGVVHGIVVIGLQHDFALEIDLHEARGVDLVEEEAVGIDEEMLLRPRHPRGDVGVDHVGHAVMRDEPVAGGEIDPRLPFLGAHALADGLTSRLQRRRSCHRSLLNSSRMIQAAQPWRERAIGAGASSRGGRRDTRRRRCGRGARARQDAGDGGESATARSRAAAPRPRGSRRRRAAARRGVPS